MAVKRKKEWQYHHGLYNRRTELFQFKVHNYNPGFTFIAGTGASSGVNFAIPIDTVVQYVPILIVYGTPYKDRF